MYNNKIFFNFNIVKNFSLSKACNINKARITFLLYQQSRLFDEELGKLNYFQKYCFILFLNLDHLHNLIVTKGIPTKIKYFIDSCRNLPQKAKAELKDYFSKALTPQSTIKEIILLYLPVIFKAYYNQEYIIFEDPENQKNHLRYSHYHTTRFLDYIINPKNIDEVLKFLYADFNYSKALLEKLGNLVLSSNKKSKLQRLQKEFLHQNKITNYLIERNRTQARTISALEVTCRDLIDKIDELTSNIQLLQKRISSLEHHQAKTPTQELLTWVEKITFSKRICSQSRSYIEKE